MSKGYGTRLPKLTGFEVEMVNANNDMTALTGGTQPVMIVTLRGEYMIERAMMLFIQIGDINVTSYKILPDQCAITCYLTEIPPEGARIRISYGKQWIEMPTPFTRNPN